MAFWNKSDDPWDRKPGKQGAPADWPVEEKEAEPGLLDQFKDWNESRKVEKAQRETPPEPIPCPWCGKLMETGHLAGDRGVWWAPGVPKAQTTLMGASSAEGAWNVATLGTLRGYQTAWYCEDCRKLVVDVPVVRNRYDEYQQQLEETKRRRESGGEG